MAQAAWWTLEREGKVDQGREGNVAQIGISGGVGLNNDGMLL